MFRRTGIALVVGALFVSGCAITPSKITLKEQSELLREDRAKIQKDVEPVGDALSLHEAVARGLKYNLDHRSKMMEQAVAIGTSDLSKYDMLPRLLGNAGYNYRNNDFRAIQRDLTGAQVGTGGTISSERDYVNHGISLTWSLLDFGISYYTARQNADKILVASERRRRTMHVLVQDIQVAYLRAASAQKLRSELARVIKDANEAVDNSRKVEKEGLRPLIDTLRFQKSLLDNIKILETIDQELSTAQVELNQLINVPASAKYKFEDPDLIPVPATYGDVDPEEFELRALAMNADLRESMYNARVALEETKKALLKYFPNLTANYGPQRSDNEFYVNKSWTEGAAQLSFNFFNILAAPGANRLAKANKELADQKRMMMQMAVVTQVHLVKLQLGGALQLYKLSADIDSVDSRLAKIAVDREKAGATSQAERVAAEASAIVSRLRKYQALSQVFAATGRMQATTGLEPKFDSVDMTPLPQMVAVVKDSFDAWNSGRLPQLPSDAAERPAGPSKKQDTGIEVIPLPERKPAEKPISKEGERVPDVAALQPDQQVVAKDAEVLPQIVSDALAKPVAERDLLDVGEDLGLEGFDDPPPTQQAEEEELPIPFAELEAPESLQEALDRTERLLAGAGVDSVRGVGAQAEEGLLSSNGAKAVEGQTVGSAEDFTLPLDLASGSR